MHPRVVSGLALLFVGTAGPKWSVGRPARRTSAAQLARIVEHRRIRRGGFRSAVAATGADGFGKGLGQMTFFAPFALRGLE
jgi:hypothetical protein